MNNDMNDTLNILYGLFERVDDNEESNKGWKNLKLAKEIYSVIRDLPLRIEGELTPYAHICFIDYILTHSQIEDMPRFALEAYRHALPLFDEIREDDIELELLSEYEVSREDILEKIAYLEDYIDPEVTVEEFCDKYECLKFDDVERSEKWEEIIYSVEKVCGEQMDGDLQGMGFCHEYWKLKADVLKQFGIEWKNPAQCNPNCLFD